jgi:hypothetical protein
MRAKSLNEEWAVAIGRVSLPTTRHGRDSADIRAASSPDCCE